MTTTFQTIIADPPWKFSDHLTMSEVKRGAKSQYKAVMKLSDIKSLPVKDVADPDGCVLALWVPGSMIQDALDVMKGWGFDHKQTYVWVKTKKNPLIKLMGRIKKLKKNFDLNAVLGLMADISMSEVLDFGMGRLFRQTHELCLIGTNSNKVYQHLKNKSQRSVCFGAVGEHSEKPEDLHEALELMFPDSEGRRLELFGRREKEGWTVLGNEVGECLDIRESLPKLIKEIEEMTSEIVRPDGSILLESSSFSQNIDEIFNVPGWYWFEQKGGGQNSNVWRKIEKTEKNGVSVVVEFFEHPSSSGQKAHFCSPYDHLNVHNAQTREEVERLLDLESFS